MNLSGPDLPDIHKSADQWFSDACSTRSVMLPMSRELSSPPDVRNVSDDRIHPQIRRRRAAFVTTADGDVVIVQPSFDEKSPNCSPMKQALDWQVRSPQQENQKHGDCELRNPSSPPPGNQGSPFPRHTRNLSAHFFDATSLGRSGSSDSLDKSKVDEYREKSRKHRRMMSNGRSNPNVAHRRINSIGNSEAVSRRQYHQREHSAGLDILSAAVDASKDELAHAAGEQRVLSKGDWEPPTSLQQPHLMGYDPHSYPPPHHQLAHSMQPPHNRRFSGPPPPSSYVPSPSLVPYSHHGYSSYPPGTFYAPGFPARQGYQAQQYPSQHSTYPPPSHKGMMYPPVNRSRTQDYSAASVVPTKDPEWSSRDPAGTHQGSQTFVTAMAIGGSSKNLRPAAHQRNAATNTDTGNVPDHISHHRKMSSFSSLGLGTIFGPNVLSPVGEHDAHPLKSGARAHHRSTSSTVSFMNALDVGGMDGTADETFLRNLQESSNSEYRSPVPPEMPSNSKTTSATFNPDDDSHGYKLAAGGTSKRVRRKCTAHNCPNRVVQGGLCIAHGAKRKTCAHPGCPKNVKKAGLCSTHGPARKRCETRGCEKVAVQGGKCIAHGAKKKLCEFEGCNKQAILCGMCKKHHDKSRGGSDGSTDSDDSRAAKKLHKSSHTRGLSIFHDISADAVQSLLNAETVVATSPAAAAEPPRRSANEGVW